MDFTRYNKSQFEKINWSKKTEGFNFKKLSDYYENGVKKVRVYGFFFTKSKDFGLQSVAIADDCLINLPKYVCETISEMLKDKEAVKSIDSGECAIEIDKYHSKFNKDCYSVKLVNYDTQDTLDEPLF